MEPEPATGPGHLAVAVSGGWANVYDGHGRFLGVTPLNAELAPGTHRVQLRFYGEPPPVTVSVDVRSGETTRLRRAAPPR